MLSGPLGCAEAGERRLALPPNQRIGSSKAALFADETVSGQINYDYLKVNHQFCGVFHLARLGSATDKIGLTGKGCKNMALSESEAEVAAFIRLHGVTRCPTACVVRTQATIDQADREALQRRAAEEEDRRKRRSNALAISFGRKSLRRS